MTLVDGLGSLSHAWEVERAKWLLDRQHRPVRPHDRIVTAFRDGQVTLRDNRRTDGFTQAVQETGYQGVRLGDLVVHSMDGFAGAIGVSDSDGKASPVVHCYRSSAGSDARYIAYCLRAMALNGFIATLAKGIRERSTAFDPATLTDVTLPSPPLKDQERISDFLDSELRRIRTIRELHMKMRKVALERGQRVLDGLVETDVRELVPLRYVVAFREGPGIMANDFMDDGVPLIRLAGMQQGVVTLRGCNYLDPTLVASKWNHFRLRMGDYLISGSATMGEVSLVDDQDVVGGVPYTGLIILRALDCRIHMPYIASVLRSSLFGRQIDLLKTGATMQHFGPTHLSQVKVPIPDLKRQRSIAREASARRQHVQALVGKVDRQLALLAERQQSLIIAAVTGQIDVATARTDDLS